MSIDDFTYKAERLRALTYGRGIQNILEEVYAIIRSPLVIFDMEYKLIAHSHMPCDDDPIWNEFMQHGQLRAGIIEFMKHEGFIDEVANSTMQNGIAYLVSDKLKYDRVFGQLYDKNHVPIADMVIVACETPFGDETTELVKIVCDVFSNELAQSAYYQDYGQAYKESIVRELLDDSIKDPRLYTGHVANIDKDLRTDIYLAVADIAQCKAEYSNLTYCRDLFKRIESNFEYYIYQNYIVILMSWDCKMQITEEKDFRKLHKLFKWENIYAGVSRGFENLFELRKYYAEAIEALNYAVSSDGVKRIFLYDDIARAV